MENWHVIGMWKNCLATYVLVERCYLEGQTKDVFGYLPLKYKLMRHEGCLMVCLHGQWKQHYSSISETHLEHSSKPTRVGWFSKELKPWTSLSYDTNTADLPFLAEPYFIFHFETLGNIGNSSTPVVLPSEWSNWEHHGFFVYMVKYVDMWSRSALPYYPTYSRTRQYNARHPAIPKLSRQCWATCRNNCSMLFTHCVTIDLWSAGQYCLKRLLL